MLAGADVAELRENAWHMLRRSNLPDWATTVVDLPRYWFRAAEYGLSIRLAQASFKPAHAALALLRLALSGFAASAAIVALVKVVESSLPFSYGVAAILVLLVALLSVVLLVRNLGSLSGIMDIAARSGEGAARLRRDMATGMRNDWAYGKLIELYRPIVYNVNVSLMREGSTQRMEIVKADEGGSGSAAVAYAAVAVAAGDGDSLQSLLADPISEEQHHRFRRLGESRQRLMRKWREMDTTRRAMEDETGDNYCLRRLGLGTDGDGDRIRIATGVATYGEIVRSCDALINEFALFAYLTGPLGKRWRASPFRRGGLAISSAAMLRCLPWRHRAHRLNHARPRDLRRHRFSRPHRPAPGSRLFLEPADRAAGIGIAVVTLDRRRGDDWAFLGIRSGQVGTYPATNHVAPAGMCNSYGTHLTPQSRGEPPPESYLETAMRCEFLEELFREPEFENNKRPDWRERVERAWREKAFTVEDLKLTGIAFDLLNLRPEVCATAIVDTSDGELNWEFDALGTERPLAEMGRIARTQIVQSGAAALMLARRSRRRSVDQGQATVPEAHRA